MLEIAGECIVFFLVFFLFCVCSSSSPEPLGIIHGHGPFDQRKCPHIPYVDAGRRFSRAFFKHVQV